MRNPQLMLKKLTANRFHLVVVGDTYQGEKRGYRLLPSQSHKGARRSQVLALAKDWSEQQVLAFASRKVGSYVNARVRKALEPIGEQIIGGRLNKRPDSELSTVVYNSHEKTPTIPVPTVGTLDGTDEAADLIVRRRAALKLIAEIDLQLQGFIDTRAVEVIQRGMATPLSSLN